MPLPVDYHDGIAHAFGSSAAAARNQALMGRYYYGKVAKLTRLPSLGGVLDSTITM